MLETNFDVPHLLTNRSPTSLLCTALYCTLLHCTALYCTVLYCNAMYCTVLHSYTMCSTAIYCPVLQWIREAGVGLVRPGAKVAFPRRVLSWLPGGAGVGF